MLILDETPMRFPSNYVAEYIYCRVNDLKFNKNFMSVALGGTGCLTGDTRINCNRAEKGRTFTIADMFFQYHNNSKSKKLWNMNIPTYVRSYNGKSIGLQKIKDVVYSGKQDVFELTLENDKLIKATKNHLIMTKRGWIELHNLNMDDEVMCDNLYPQKKGQPTFSKVKEIKHIGIKPTYDIVCDEPNHNFVANGIVVHNSGKTYSQLRLGEILDPEFNVDRVVFSVKEFMDLVNSGKLHRGSVIVSEELGTQMSRREWYAISNRLFSFILQTFRNLNLIVLFTVPNADFIDSHAMKLFHMCFETIGIDPDKQLVYIRPKLIKSNVLGGGKHYYKFLRLVDRGRVDVVDSLALKKPSKALCKAYEEKKTIFTEQLNKRVLSEVSKVEDEIRGDMLDEMATKHKEVLKAYTKGYDMEQIAEATGYSLNQIKTIMTTLRKKGLTKNIKTGEITMKLPDASEQA